MRQSVVAGLRRAARPEDREVPRPQPSRGLVGPGPGLAVMLLDVAGVGGIAQGLAPVRLETHVVGADAQRRLALGVDEPPRARPLFDAEAARRLPRRPARKRRGDERRSRGRFVGGVAASEKGRGDEDAG